MLNNVVLGQYYQADSPVHRMDPRVKLLLTIAYIVAVFLADNVVGYVALAAFLFFVVFMSKVPVMRVIRSVKPLLFILAFTFVINLFFTQQGNIVFELGPIKLRDEGIRRSVYMALRLLFLVMGTSIMTLTTSPIALTDGMESLFSPLKRFRFPAHELAMVMSIALRSIPTLLEETQKIQKAQMARGADFESGNIIARAKAMIPILVPLFISAFRRADELAMAMESRCYHGGEGRTRMKQLHIASRDILAVGVVAALIAVLALWG